MLAVASSENFQSILRDIQQKDKRENKQERGREGGCKQIEMSGH